LNSREEFHRRLKVYHAWKAKNKGGPKGGGGEIAERAPKSVYQHMLSNNSLSPSPTPPGSDGDINQRYFRVPFTKDGQNTGYHGLWYAHFDGQYIARQMELYGGRPPALLIAGTPLTFLPHNESLSPIIIITAFLSYP